MKITIQNFRCFEKKELEFNESNITLLKAPSGAGKSTILEAIRYCIYGNMRNIYPMNFKPSQANQTKVCLEFPGKKLYRIERSQPPEILRVFIRKDSTSDTKTSCLIPEADFDILESEAGQRYIDSAFSTKDIWAVSSYLSQGDRCPLMTQPNSEKMNLLCEILFGNKFNSDVNTYENPDWYSERIEKELNEVNANLTTKTNNYNDKYGKYMEAIQQYKPNPNKPWKNLPTEADLNQVGETIQKLQTEITQITQEMVETKGKETEKELYSQRLIELKEKLKALEEMNSQDLTEFLRKTRDEIKFLEQEIQGLNTQYLSTLAEEQKRDLLQKEINNLSSELSKFKDLENHFESKNQNDSKSDLESKIKLLEQSLFTTQFKETELHRIQTQLNETKSNLTLIEQKISIYPSLEIEDLRAKIINTQSFHKLKNIQDKEPEKIEFNYSEDEIRTMQSTLPTFITETNKNIIILRNNNLIKDVIPITETFEASIKQHLTGVKQVLDFIEIMKQELNKQTQLDQIKSKISVIQSELSELKTKILENESKLEDSKITSCNLESYITLKNEIQMNIGENLLCPDCNSTLELNHTSKGMKLCKLTKPKWTREEGQTRIELLNRLSEMIKLYQTKQTECEYLQKTNSELPLPKPEYISEQVLKTYTPEAIDKYTSFYDSVSQFKFGIKNQFADTVEKAEFLLNQIPKVQTRILWEKEYTQAKETLSIDDKLNLLTESEIHTYQALILEIPKVLQQQKQYQEIIKKLETDLSELNKFFESNNSSKELEAELTQAKELNKRIKQYTEIKTKFDNLQQQFTSILIHISSEEILSKLTYIKSQLQTKKEIISGFSQYEVLTEEISKIESKFNSILIIETSENLNSKLSQINQEIEDLHKYREDGKLLFNMSSLRAQLEILQKEVIELTTQQSHLNRLKLLIIEVSNSSLQNLVDSINVCTNNVLEELFENDIRLELKLFKEQKKTNQMKPQINFSIFYNNNVYDNIMGLSGGEKDRISLALTIALACVSPSPILMLDECMSSLNLDLREKCVEALKRFVIGQAGKILISVEHLSIEGQYDAVIEL